MISNNDDLCHVSTIDVLDLGFTCIILASLNKILNLNKMIFDVIS